MFYFRHVTIVSQLLTAVQGAAAPVESIFSPAVLRRTNYSERATSSVSLSYLRKSEITCSNNGSSSRRLLEIPPGNVISGGLEAEFAAGAGSVAAILYAENEDLLFAGGDQVVQFWRGADVSFYAGASTESIVSALTYVPVGRQLAVAGQNGVLSFLQVSDRAINAHVKENAAGGVVTAVAYLEYSDDVQSYAEVATASPDRDIKLWDVSSFQYTRTFSGHQRPVLVLRYLRPVKMLVSGGLDGLIGFWYLPKATRLAVGRRCVGPKTFLRTSFQASECLAHASSEGGEFFIHGLEDGISANQCEMELSSCETLQDGDYTLYRLEKPLRFLLSGHEGAIRALEYIPDLRLVASGGNDGTIRLWDPIAGEQLRILASLGDPVSALLYLSELRVLVAATLNQLMFLDSQTGVQLKTMVRNGEAISLQYLGPHGLIAAPDGENIQLYRVLEFCADGQRPADAANCEPCPANLAGKGGFCPEVCSSGKSSNANRTFCVDCALGTAGTNGFCEKCAPGRYQDQTGRVSCKRCRKGTAQPFQGQSVCVPCVDNTAATSIGQAECEECFDGTEPSIDNTRCVQCPEGTAGERGVCFPCKDGQQPNEALSQCIPCPQGTAGVDGLCVLCPDGLRPTAQRTECEPCPPAFAGTKGLCTRCQPGQMPADDRSFCMSCPPGEAGENGTCAPCPNGYIPDSQRVTCEECPGGQPSYRGECTPCRDGTRPASDREKCLSCPRGAAGTNGECSDCAIGLEATEDHTQCVPCNRTSVSTTGVCENCADGTQPNTEQSACLPCPAGTAGQGGMCLPCEDGFQQDFTRSKCEPCPVGSAGVGGTCSLCPHPLMQNAERTECTLQTLPPYFLFDDARCLEHPVCAESFAHEPGSEEGRVFCCPSPDGDLLACCQFESAEEAVRWQSIAEGLDNLIGTLTTAMWYVPPISLLGGVAMLFQWHKMRTSEAWEDWRDDWQFSKASLATLPLLWLATVVILPWMLLVIIWTSWFALLAAVLFGFLCRVLLTLSAECSYDKRPKAVWKLRRWWMVMWLAELLAALVQYVQDFFTVRLIFADICAAAGVPLIRQMPFEQLALVLPLPDALVSPFRIMFRTVRVPEITMANVLVHIDLHSESVVTTLLAAAALSFAVASTMYLLLVGNVAGRFGAAWEAVLLARMPPRWRVRRLAIVGSANLLVTLAIHLASVCPARLGTLLWQLTARRKVEAGGFSMYTSYSVMMCVASIQLAILLMWGAVASGAHVDNPPKFLATFLQRLGGVDFEERRRETFVVRSVLESLGLAQPEAEEEADVASPRSPRGGSSARGNSARGFSARGSARSARSNPSNQSPRSGRSGGASPGRPSSGRAAMTPRHFKVVKNLGSAGAALRRLAGGVDADKTPRGHSPRHGGASSPGAGDHTARSARMNRGPGRRPMKSIRLPDGSHVQLPLRRGGSPRRMGASPRNKSKDGMESPKFSPRAAAAMDSPKLSPRAAAVAAGESARTVGSPMSGAASAKRSPGAGFVSRLSSMVRSSTAIERSDNLVDFRSSFSRRGSTRTSIGGTNSVDVRQLLSLSSWEQVAEDDDEVDLTQLKVTPQSLFNRIPRPDVQANYRGFLAGIYCALRCSFWTSVGFWKTEWNTGPHKVRRRTRDMTAETGRLSFDKYDYEMVQRAAAKTIATSATMLPGGHLLYMFMHHLNHPVFRQSDRALDIVLHKIEELIERGIDYKQAEISVKRSVIANAKHQKLASRAQRLHNIQKWLNLGLLATLLVASLLMDGRNSFILAPPVFTCALGCMIAHTFIEVILLPMMMLPNVVLQSVYREVEEEKKVRDMIAEVLGESEGELTEEDSTDYSSANESFLDEDPASDARPFVIGAKSAKVIVRPKAARLKLRFTLLRGTKAVGDHTSLWRREAVLKHGRLMHTPDSFLTFAQRARTVSFSPTEESDWDAKFKKHIGNRSKSLGTITAEERIERRAEAERWAGFIDIFEERSRLGMPSMPTPGMSVPDRGLPDVFEDLGAFREPEEEVSNHHLFFMNPLKDTAAAEQLRFLLGAELPKPWEESFDEAVEHERQRREREQFVREQAAEASRRRIAADPKTGSRSQGHSSLGHSTLGSENKASSSRSSSEQADSSFDFGSDVTL